MTTQDIKFKAGGHSHALGNFAAGDIARGIPEALARHLVEEANAADYLQPVKAADPTIAPVDAPAKRTRKPKAGD
jgi:hypothetical protein